MNNKMTYGGTKFTDEGRIEQEKESRLGIRHDHALEPLAPTPGSSPVASVRVAVPQAIERITCTIEMPERIETPLHPGRVEWDHLHWGYAQIWQCSLPAYPQDTLVKYTILAYPADGSDPIAADDGALYAYYVDEPGPPEWAKEAIIYQIFPDRFHPGKDRAWIENAAPDEIHGGTLYGVLEHLDYIADLGFNCLWLNPFLEDKTTYHRYHATDYFKVDPRLGSNELMKELVREAHKRGIRMVLDFVANHWGSNHHTFLEAQRDPQSDYVNWYYWTNYPDDYEMYFSVKDLPKVNVDYPAAREYLMKAAEFWVTEMDFDGYRLDHANGVAHNFWADFRARVKSARIKSGRPDVWLYGESVDTPKVQLGYDGRFHGSLDFLISQAFYNIFAWETMNVTEFDAFLTSHEAYFPSTFSRPCALDNHDRPRFLWEAKGDKRKLKVAALCQFTLSGPPIVYYGTEVGMPGTDDQTYATDANWGGARLRMFTEDQWDKELHSYYRWLINFRREHPVIWSGERKTVLADGEAGHYVYTVSDETETIVVALNLGDAQGVIEVEGETFELEGWSGDVRVSADELPLQSKTKRPNPETQEAMQELEEGGGELLDSTEDLFTDWNTD